MESKKDGRWYGVPTKDKCKWDLVAFTWVRLATCNILISSTTVDKSLNIQSDQAGLGPHEISWFSLGVESFTLGNLDIALQFLTLTSYMWSKGKADSQNPTSNALVKILARCLADLMHSTSMPGSWKAKQVEAILILRKCWDPSA